MPIQANSGDGQGAVRPDHGEQHRHARKHREEDRTKSRARERTGKQLLHGAAPNARGS